MLDLHLELVIYVYNAISLLMAAGAYNVVTSCTQAELTHNRLLTAKFFFKYAVIFLNFKRNFLTGLSPTKSRLRNKCVRLSAIRVVESASDDYNFQLETVVTSSTLNIATK